LTVLVRTGAAAVSGAILIPAFSPGSGAALAWVGLVPFLLALRRSTPGVAAWLGLVMGGVLEGVGHRYLMASGVAAPAYALIVLYLASRFALFGFLASLVWRWRPASAAIGVPALWVILEYVQLHVGWLSIPWLLLGLTQQEVLPVARIASVGGVYAVSFAVLVVNLVLVHAVESLLARGAEPAPARMPTWSPALGLAVAILVALLLGANPPEPSAAHASPAAGPIRIAVVQAGAYGAEGEEPGSQDQVLARYFVLTREAALAAPDLIVWPESAVPVALPYDGGAMRKLQDLARELETPLLVGSSGREKRDPGDGPAGIANSAFLIHPDDDRGARYDKVRLLPFNEYVPARWFPWPDWILESDFRDARRGERSPMLEWPGMRVGVQICWEALFPEEARSSAAQGADVLVTLTNESFTNSEAAYGHFFAMNRFRAIENGLPLVRATTTSWSAVIAPSGRILAERRSRGILVAELPQASGPTLYARFGDWFVLALCLAAVILRGRRPSSR
jgi:apolipoprotein N-acyltransferase